MVSTIDIGGKGRGLSVTAAKLSDLQSQKFEKIILNCACSEIGFGYDERVIGFSN